MANKKFKAVEKNAKNVPTGDKEIQWEGEEITAQSNYKLEDDKGEGKAVILRFFDFAANPETFKYQKPTAQQLFNTHIRGIEALLWKDGLQPFSEVQPRLLFSKNKENYRFIIPCIGGKGHVLVDSPRTLSQLAKNDTRQNSL